MALSLERRSMAMPMPSPPASIMGTYGPLRQELPPKSVQPHIYLPSSSCSFQESAHIAGDVRQLLTPDSQPEEPSYPCDTVDNNSVHSIHLEATILALKRLLDNPIAFLPASRLTLDDEMAGNRKRKAVENLSDEHTRRRRRVLSMRAITRRSRNSQNQPPGLINSDNVCYRRAVLQSFLNIPRVVDFLHHHSKDYGCLNDDHHDTCFVCDLKGVAQAYEAYLTTMKKDQEQTQRDRSEKKRLKKRAVDIAVTKLDKAIIRVNNPDFDWAKNTGIQADAQEFLINCMLAYLEDTPKSKKSVFPGLFKLLLSTSWICENCSAPSSPVFEDGFELGVHLDKNANPGLQQLVDRSFSNHTPGIICGNCNTAKDRMRRSKIVAAPQTLIIHLRRFEYTNRSRKITSHVDIPMFLDLSKHAQNPNLRKNGMLKYKLSSVVSHKGSMDFGHYVCWAQTAKDTVYKFDDNDVTETNFDDMVNPTRGFTPYLCFYTNAGSHLGATSKRWIPDKVLNDGDKELEDGKEKDCKKTATTEALKASTTEDGTINVPGALHELSVVPEAPNALLLKSKY